MGAGNRIIDNEGTALAARLLALRLQKAKQSSELMYSEDIAVAEKKLADHIQKNAKIYSKLAIEQILGSQASTALGESYIKLAKAMSQKPAAKV